MKNKIYQTGTIASLIQCVYDGDTIVKNLSKYGDFGLGTVDAIDGELIILDGFFYLADVNSKISVINNLVKTPFAVISHFKPELSEQIVNVDFHQFEQEYLKNFPSLNYVYAIKIVANFSYIKIRSESCQTKPYKKLSETMPKLQKIHEFRDIKGTLVGVWYPEFMAGLNVPGFHFHFIDEKRLIGGHVFDFNILNGEVSLQKIASVQIDFIETQEFEQANLSLDHADDILKVEKIR